MRDEEEDKAVKDREFSVDESSQDASLGLGLSLTQKTMRDFLADMMCAN